MRVLTLLISTVPVSSFSLLTFRSSKRSSLAFCFVLRALAPRMTHASSLRKILRRFLSAA